jgi:metal-dependent amidase/aminoacylase/carboxypeptidase family protein
MKRMFVATAVVLSIVMQSFATDMSREIDAAAAKVLPQVIEWRRYLHQHPELSNREVNTSKMVADELRKLGIEVRTGIAKTGVIGILKGGQPGPVIGL